MRAFDGAVEAHGMVTSVGARMHLNGTQDLAMTIRQCHSGARKINYLVNRGIYEPIF
jgi:hypothetical protein